MTNVTPEIKKDCAINDTAFPNDPSLSLNILFMELFITPLLKKVMNRR